MRRVLVTGGAGFVGSHLVRRLIARGDEVHLLLRGSTRLDRLHDLADRLTFHRLDLGDRAALGAAVKAAAPHEVYHLAVDTRGSTTPDLPTARQSVTDNLLVLIDLLAALSDLPEPPQALVRAGTIAEYGRSPLPFREEAREDPVNPYGAGMLAGTHYLAMLEGALQFPVRTARLALIYGQHQSGEFLIPRMIRACLEGRPSRVDRPEDTRDLLFVSDAVEALLALGACTLPGSSVLNIGTGHAPTMREVAQLILQTTGADPALVSFGEGKSRPGIADLQVCSDRAKAALGWSATTTLAQGIAATVAAMRAVQPTAA